MWEVLSKSTEVSFCQLARAKMRGKREGKDRAVPRGGLNGECDLKNDFESGRGCSTEGQVQLSNISFHFVLFKTRCLWHQLPVVRLRMDFWADRFFWKFLETQMGCFVLTP